VIYFWKCLNINITDSLRTYGWTVDIFINNFYPDIEHLLQKGTVWLCKRLVVNTKKQTAEKINKKLPTNIKYTNQHYLMNTEFITQSRRHFQIFVAKEVDRIFLEYIISGIYSPWELLKYNISHVKNRTGEPMTHVAFPIETPTFTKPYSSGLPPHKLTLKTLIILLRNLKPSRFWTVTRLQSKKMA